MNKRTLRSARNNNKRVHGRSNLDDFISQMPDDILVKILSLLPITEAGATSCLSTRWRFLWCYLTRLNFDGTETLEKMANDHKLSVSEREKFVNQVCNVIASHHHPTVTVFQMLFDLDESNYLNIDFWLRFALDKKVEMLDLNLMEKRWKTRDNPSMNYDFPLPSSNGNMIHLVEWPSANYAMVVEMRSLKEVSLMGVNISGPNLLGLLKRSPCLETLYIYGSCLSTDIHVGGRDISLKHFTIVSCSEVESISFYDFDLVSFIYNGPEINLHLTGLRMLKNLEFGQTGAELKNNVLAQISSIASSVQDLCLGIQCPKESYNVNSIPKLPNVKKLVLIIGAEGDDSLLEFTSIAKACPRLVNFEIELIWSSPIKRRKKVKHAAPHPHEHLKFFKFGGFYGRISDLELAMYVIDNAAALRKITIDPDCMGLNVDLTVEEISKREKTARSFAERQIRPILPRGVELVIV